jgi:hypothetical protein
MEADHRRLNRSGQLACVFSGAYSRQDGSPFPIVFTLGCLKLPPRAVAGNDNGIDAAT